MSASPDYDGMFMPLTRPELDALLADAEHAYTKAHIALALAPLEPERIALAAGVAQDCLNMWQDVLDASISSMWAGRG